MWWGEKLRHLIEGLGALFFPPHCAGCQVPTRWDVSLCGDCLEAAPRVGQPRCDTCSQPFDGEIEGGRLVCPNCGVRQFAFRYAVAVFRRRGWVARLIAEFKYRGQSHRLLPLGVLLREAMEDDRLRSWDFDAITPVPLHRRRRRERGFNQAAELAGVLASRCGRPVVHLLERTRATETQTHFDRRQRMENLRNAFRPRKNAVMQDLRILLVDDVLTTGSTLDECARVLRGAGAAEVRAVVVARS